LWYELRCHGLELPFTIGMVLVLFVAGLWFGKAYEAAFRELEKGGLPPQVRVAFIGLLALVPFLAIFTGVSLGNTGARGSSPKSFMLPAFLAVRPLSEGALVAAKLKAAVLITLVSWAMLLVVVPPALLATDTWNEAVGWILEWLGQQPPLQALGLVVLAVVLLVGETWAGMAGTLFLGLLGRAWIVRTLGAAAALLVIPLLMFANWILKHPQSHAALVSAVPWVLGGAVALKVVMGMAVARVVRRRRLIADRSLGAILGTWFLAVAGSFGLLWWLIPHGLAPWYVLACSVILLVPINRLLAAPLALAWNRHR
jgi:hypothetical protein